MSDALQIIDFIFGALAFAALAYGFYAYYYQRKREERLFRQKSYMENVQFSLNYVDTRDNTLKIRTIMNEAGSSVFLDQYALNKVTKAAGQTTLEDGVVSLKKGEDQAFVTRSIVNALSARYGDTFLRDAMRGDEELGINTAEFAVCLTNEKYEGIKTQQLRVMVIETNLLQKFSDSAFVDKLNYEVPDHDIRSITLSKIAEYFENKSGAVRTMMLGSF